MVFRERNAYRGMRWGVGWSTPITGLSVQDIGYVMFFLGLQSLKGITLLPPLA